MKVKSGVKIVYLVIIVVLLLIVSGEFIYFNNKLSSGNTISPSRFGSDNFPLAGPNARGRGGPPVIMSKGMNLKTSPIFKYAYQIAPGDLSASAKQALTGWSVKSETQSDCSLLVTLTPKDSDDQYQQYLVKTGQTLYFIEQTPSDDKADSDTDLNYRDDYGIIVDSGGVIQ